MHLDRVCTRLVYCIYLDHVYTRLELCMHLDRVCTRLVYCRVTQVAESKSAINDDFSTYHSKHFLAKKTFAFVSGKSVVTRSCLSSSTTKYGCRNFLGAARCTCKGDWCNGASFQQATAATLVALLVCASVAARRF